MTAYTRILFPQYFDGKGVSYRVTISKEKKKKKKKKKKRKKKEILKTNDLSTIFHYNRPF